MCGEARFEVISHACVVPVGMVHAAQDVNVGEGHGARGSRGLAMINTGVERKARLRSTSYGVAAFEGAKKPCGRYELAISWLANVVGHVKSALRAVESSAVGIYPALHAPYFWPSGSECERQQKNGDKRERQQQPPFKALERLKKWALANGSQWIAFNNEP